MGKKPQKTKELWAAIAEASSTIDETEQQQPQPQPQATRKRGRPRKIIVKMESAEEKAAPEAIEQPAAEETAQSSTMEKGTVNEEENKHEGTSSSACMRVTKQEGVSEEMEIQLPKGEPTRSRARRKSKPRKSS